jgi:hypothetical protein
VITRVVDLNSADNGAGDDAAWRISFSLGEAEDHRRVVATVLVSPLILAVRPPVGSLANPPAAT